MFRLKNRPQPTLATRPSVLAGETFDPKDGDAMINDAGKHEVKSEGIVAARRQTVWAPLGRADGVPEMSRRTP